MLKSHWQPWGILLTAFTVISDKGGAPGTLQSVGKKPRAPLRTSSTVIIAVSSLESHGGFFAHRLYGYGEVSGQPTHNAHQSVTDTLVLDTSKRDRGATIVRDLNNSRSAETDIPRLATVSHCQGPSSVDGLRYWVGPPPCTQLREVSEPRQAALSEAEQLGLRTFSGAGLAAVFPSNGPRSVDGPSAKTSTGLCSQARLLAPHVEFGRSWYV
ncbi:hypothetical protein DFJ77DRAFT_526708 [Powellomyces hirtus]|nr:hypothetical protein DFJ77DRAFT_526708 [Powellomyces hirtus]